MKTADSNKLASTLIENKKEDRITPLPPPKVITEEKLSNDDNQPSERRVSMLLLLFSGLIAFISWAAYFDIDQSVRASGQIIASDRTQIIQSADAGVLAELLVREGEVVSAGQRLAVLEKERINATYEESRSKVAALDIALLRVKAETKNKSPNFDAFKHDFPEFVMAQTQLYKQNKKRLTDELNTLKLSQNIIKKELSVNENLFKTGDASKLEVMRAERQLSEINGKISDANNKYLQEAHKELSTLEADLDVARYKYNERKNVLDHTDIKAPVAGIVKYMKLNTVGGVLRAGDELMQISPTESDMVVEVKVNPVDIGQLYIGLPVSVKLDAFDYSIYGSLEGVLTYISSDTLTEQVEEQSNTYYRAQIQINEREQQINPKIVSVAIKPGMTATVDIKTNQRSVLHYLVKPIARAFGGAMNER